MGGIMDLLMVVLVIGGGYWLWQSGKLDEIIQGLQKGELQLPALPGLPPPPPLRAPGAPPVSAPAPTPSDSEDEPEEEATPIPVPSGGGGSNATGKTIYQVVSNIPAPPNVTIRGGGNSYRDNISYPCNKCAREATWIFRPGTAGDWSPKLGSHGDTGGKETLIELANIQMNGTGGDWQCEGPHMNYNKLSGGTGSAPRLAGKARVGIKAVTWPLPGNQVHHELWYDETGSGNNWQKFAEFSGAATGCTAITCPVPGNKCQDTMRLDNPSGHQFIARSMVEIKPGSANAGGGSGVRTIGNTPSSAPAPTTTGKRTIGAVRVLPVAAKPTLAPRPTTPSKVLTTVTGVGGYECFEQQEDEIPVDCCRFKTKPPEEPHCKSSLIAGEYLKCCRDDKKAWGGLW